MTSLAIRRIAAWCVDWLIIVGYAVALIPLGVLVNRSVSLSAAAGNLLSFALLVAPATAWLAAWEAGPRAASPGKRLLRLRVKAAAGSSPSPARALLRNALKVALPWELGHTAAFTLTSPSAAGPASVVAAACGIAACAIVAGYVVSLFVGSGRAPYDRLVGTWVGARD